MSFPRPFVLSFLAACACLSASVGASAQDAPGRAVAALAQSPAVRAALGATREGEALVLADQVELTEVPAPGFHERARAEVMKRKFEQAGLRNIRVDKAGNVLGERPGGARHPHLVLAAHLDTVFPEGTDVRVRRDGTLLKAPGIGDDGRGLAVLLGVARALDKGHVVTPGTITFVADVGEEGLSDLRGMKELFTTTLSGQVDAFVSIDGSDHGITNVAVGSHRYKVTFKGPGGHSFGSFGLVNPIHALGRAVAAIAEFQVPEAPRVTFNVGRIGGGTSVNSIASESWFEMDMRSSDAAALAGIDSRFHKAVDQAVAAENVRWSNGRLTAAVELVGDRPAGVTSQHSRIVLTAVAVNEVLGLPVTLGEGSTDANIPISLGIPAITIGGGGRSSGGHSLAESFDPTDSWRGTQRVLLLVVALTERGL
jgi:tripeptide aminopeptidase